MGSGIARALVCGAIWPNARVHAIDPQACALCPRCKAAVDTVHHRLWWCPEAEDERQKLVPRRLIEAARRAGPDSLFYSTGVMPHPADVWPAPTENPEVVVERLDGSAPSGEVHQFQGNFYFDGSCSTHVIPELRRAGWAIVVKDADGKPVARISSPLWRSLPQTPQAAEYVAYAAAVQFVAGASIFYGDCANVIRQAGAVPKKVCTPTARYSGVMRDTQRVPERLRQVVEFRKIKAHVDPNAIADLEQRGHAQGNAEADLLAKAAARRHPPQSPAEEALLETNIDDAVSIIKLAAAVLRHWPPQEKTPRPKRTGAGPGAPKKNGRAHVWEFVDSAWRCRVCLRCAIGAKENPRGTRGFCTGGTAAGKSREAEGGGHTLGYAKGVGMPIMFCYRCGSWTARRSRGLARTCAGIPTAAGRQALGYINKGRHPWRPPDVDEGSRPAVVVGGRELWVETEGVESAEMATIDATTAAPEAALQSGCGVVPSSVSGEAALQTMPGPVDWQCAEDGGDAGDAHDVFGHGGSLDEEPSLAEQPLAKRPRGAQVRVRSDEASGDRAEEMGVSRVEATMADVNTHVWHGDAAATSAAPHADWHRARHRGERRPRDSPQPHENGPPRRRFKVTRGHGRQSGDEADGSGATATTWSTTGEVADAHLRPPAPGPPSPQRRPERARHAPADLRHRLDGPPAVRECEEGPPRRKPRLDRSRQRGASPVLAQPRHGGSPSGPNQVSDQVRREGVDSRSVRRQSRGGGVPSSADASGAVVGADGGGPSSNSALRARARGGARLPPPRGACVAEAAVGDANGAEGSQGHTLVASHNEDVDERGAMVAKRMAAIRRRIRARSTNGGDRPGGIESMQGDQRKLDDECPRQRLSTIFGTEGAASSGAAVGPWAAPGRIRGRDSSPGQGSDDVHTAHLEDAQGAVIRDGLGPTVAVGTIRGRSRSPGHSGRSSREQLLQRLRSGAGAAHSAVGPHDGAAAVIRADTRAGSPPAPCESAVASSGTRRATLSPRSACLAAPLPASGALAVASLPAGAHRAPASPTLAAGRNARAELLRRLSASGT